MIDSLNRRSLRELYKDSGPKSHKFSQVNSDNYKRLKMTFDSILERTDLFAPYRDQIEIPDRAVADRRFIDAYFVTWGRKLKEEDLRAKRAGTLP